LKAIDVSPTLDNFFLIVEAIEFISSALLLIKIFEIFISQKLKENLIYI